MSLPALMLVSGARPNFMKIAPIMAALRRRPERGLRPCLLHTGQHYDAQMKATFFEQLGIPEPEIDLGVGSGSHAQQTAEIMRRFEPVLDQVRPAAVLVVGDVNSTIACALVASKKGVPVIHVEAGLRSYDRSMPEEVNRVLTDQLADLLFTTERDAADNLAREGIDPARVHFVGNVMIDTLLAQRERAESPDAVLQRHLGDAAPVLDGGYALLTLHRPSNVDDADVLKRLLAVVAEIAAELPVLFTVHPRTRARLEALGWWGQLPVGIHCLPPLAYLEMLGLMAGARLLLTDSGGLQEETTALGVPCLTLRENTERPITISQGTNTLVGTDPTRILAGFQAVQTHGGKAGRVPELWDGHASERILDVIGPWLAVRHG